MTTPDRRIRRLQHHLTGQGPGPCDHPGCPTGGGVFLDHGQPEPPGWVDPCPVCGARCVVLSLGSADL